MSWTKFKATRGLSFTLLISAEIGAFVREFLHNAKFADLRQRMQSNLDVVGSLKVGSMFSGWGVVEMVVSELVTTWNAENPQDEIKARG